MQIGEGEIYSRIGQEGFTRLVAAFYRRVKTDDILGPVDLQEDWKGAEHRLRDFLMFRLRMRRAPFRVSTAARDRWVQLMDAALAEAALAAEAADLLRRFFHSNATFLINQEA